ncbi:hypothetical protein [Fulvivirga lutimaris]|uniref:hypothetical protein n=1 Tax=Fulvivirga lutimaris TaxID=1819566 RepID=UPI0012BB97E2|nr:hypothetical protein [Fulvivirga lutimaris]MTI39852.1 hypothetical protein [Fulvivirga lutimaris]
MRLLLNLPLFCFALLTIACNSSDKTNKQSSNSEEETKLTFDYVVEKVFNDDGTPVEWHGEALANDFKDSLEINKSGKCGDGDCGENMTMKNTTDQDLEVLVKGAYNIGGDEGFIACKYIIAAQSEVSIGCSHLCFEGEAYLFDRVIIGSKVYEDPEEE